ncbi:hypothetical protein QOZ80_2BG0205310 [Eleusine coracana subsp. coracana]|nr:hypothetical protein QOZ80_2BG0205310 [Eleusine coracana subsp. coracana]
MAVEEANAAPAMPLPPPRASASSPPTVGALLTRASAAVTNRECSSPRSLLSRILHRGRRGGGGGFGCRLRLLPRYCSSGAAKDDVATAITAKEELAAPKVLGSRAEPPRSSLAEKKIAEDAVPASLGLGASLVVLLSKSAAEMSRMAELRAEMERMMMDVKADVRSCNGRPSASDGHTDSASVVKEPIACAGGGDEEQGAMSQSRGGGGSENAEHGETMDQMEAELEEELSRLQLASNDEEDLMTPPGLDHQVEMEAKSGTSSGSHSVISSDPEIDDAETDQDDGEDDEEEEEEEEEEESPGHGGVSARELERRLHELLQSRHEARIAELESALDRARRKLKEKEREASRWRDTAKLAARFTDDSRLR